MDWVSTWWAVRVLAPPVLVVGLLAYFALRRHRTLARLQERWGWLGTPSRHLQSGRRWSGEIAGRPVQVTWFGDNTEVDIAAQPLASVGFVRPGQPAELAHVPGGTAVSLGAADAYARDPAVVQALAHEPGVGKALSVLLGPADQSLRAVRLDPSGHVVWFARNLPEREVTADDAHAWVSALLRVASASEQPSIA